MTSAGTVLSSALFELGSYSKNGEKYIAVATHILKSLTSSAYTELPDNKYFIINHCVGSLPHQAEVDRPLVYADYYYLEALLRQKKLAESRK